VHHSNVPLTRTHQSTTRKLVKTMTNYNEFNSTANKAFSTHTFTAENNWFNIMGIDTLEAICSKCSREQLEQIFDTPLDPQNRNEVAKWILRKIEEEWNEQQKHEEKIRKFNQEWSEITHQRIRSNLPRNFVGRQKLIWEEITIGSDDEDEDTENGETNNNTEHNITDDEVRETGRKQGGEEVIAISRREKT